jgi:hypothetical protein
MKHVTSPIRIQEAGEGMFAKPAPLELSTDAEELAFIAGADGAAGSLIYAEDAPDARPHLKPGEKAFIFTRELAIQLNVPVVFEAGYEGRAEMLLRLRILRPESSDRHPLFARVQTNDLRHLPAFEAELARVLQELFAPAVKAAFAGKSYLKMDWSVEEAARLFRERDEQFKESEHIGLREVSIRRVYSQSGEAVVRQRAVCLREFQVAESEQEFERKRRELEAAAVLSEEETAAMIEQARIRRRQARELKELLDEGKVDQARKEVEAAAAELERKERERIEAARLSDEERRIALDRMNQFHAAEKVEAEKRIELALLSVQKETMEVRLKKLECDEKSEQIEQLKEKNVSTTDQIAALCDEIQKLGSDLKGHMTAATLKPQTAATVKATWRVHHAMEKPWRPERIQLRKEELDCVDFVQSGESLQLRFESDTPGCLYVLALGPYAHQGRIDYAWTTLLSNGGANSRKYEFASGFDNRAAGNRPLLLPAAGGSPKPDDVVWTFDGATGRELLYVAFTPERLTDQQLMQIMTPPPARGYTTRGFVQSGERPDDEPSNGEASWSREQEDFRSDVLERMKAVIGGDGFVSETVLHHRG